MKIVLLSLWMVCLLACTPSDRNGSQKEKNYRNPVVDYSLPDPSVILGEDGYYYLYATEDIRNIPIHRSTDLVNWEMVGTVFNEESRPDFVPHGILWSPDINKIGDKYVLYYSMSVWAGEWTCGIGVATANNPVGPFIDLGKMIGSNEIGVQNSIDPFYIEEGGRKFLFWGSGQGIYAIELRSDGLSVMKGAEKKQVAGTGYESASVYKRNGLYYLFVSIGFCCDGLNSTSSIVVGRSENLFGPYVDKEDRLLLENNHEILIDKNIVFVGPGHNSEIITDKNGNDWVFYHAVSVEYPDGRVLLMDEINWQNDWPVVENAAPSTKARKPVI